MQIFELIKNVLDQAFENIPGTNTKKVASIKTAFSSLSSGYEKLIVGHEIDYEKPETRFAYIFKYVTCHASFIYKIISGSEVLKSVFSEDKIRVSCIGGGPGSEFLGILKYLQKNEIEKPTKFFLVDRERSWADSWSDVDDYAETKFKLTTNYLQLDAIDSSTWSSTKTYLDC
jgi:Putative SAM-dependent methyltransferase